MCYDDLGFCVRNIVGQHRKSLEVGNAGHVRDKKYG